MADYWATSLLHSILLKQGWGRYYWACRDRRVRCMYLSS